MEDSKAMVVRQQGPGQLVLSNLNDFVSFGKIMVESGMFPDVKTTAQAVVKMQAGAELGLPPLYSLQHVFITSQGKLTIDAAIMATLIKRSGTYDYQILEHTDQQCSIQMLQNGQKLGQPVVFTLDDAKRAGLTGKDPWQKYPKNLLFARAISNAARWYCPHLIGSAYTPEEMASAGGVEVRVIEEPTLVDVAGEAVVETKFPKPYATAPPPLPVERQELIIEYNAAKRAMESRGIEFKPPRRDISNADLVEFTGGLREKVRMWDDDAKAKAAYQAAEDQKPVEAEEALVGVS